MYIIMVFSIHNKIVYDDIEMENQKLKFHVKMLLKQIVI